MKTGWFKKLAVAAVASSLVLTGCSGIQDRGDSETVTLQFSSFLGPVTPQGRSLEWLFSEAEKRSNGTLKIERFWEGALLAGPDTLSGIGTARADIGHMTTLYNPAELPLTQIVGIPFVTSNVAVSEDTFNELYASNTDFQSEWQSNGVSPLFFIGVAPSIVSGKDKVSGFDWLKGKTLRATGYVAAAIEKAGGSPVGLTVAELYEAIQRGTVDGYSSMILDTIPNLSLQEVSPWIAESGIGNYTINTVVFNTDKWNQLSDDHKKIFTDLAGEWQEYYLGQLTEVEDAACKLLIENGGGSTIWADSDQDAWKNLVGNEALNQWKTDAAKSGKDVEKFYNEYISLIQGSDSEYENGMVRCAAVTP